MRCLAAFMEWLPSAFKEHSEEQQITRKFSHSFSHVFATVCLIALLLLFSGRGTLLASTSSEYKLKAAFIYNFAKFVSWPPAAFSGSNDPIILGLIDGDPFGGSIDDALEGKTAQKRQIQVKRIKSIADAKKCHILYINSTQSSRVNEILSALRGNSILTIGEADKFTSIGGIIHFVVHKQRVAFKINNEQAKNVDLAISSQLLKLAVD